jgi:hypothetical protein
MEIAYCAPMKWASKHCMRALFLLILLSVATSAESVANTISSETEDGGLPNPITTGKQGYCSNTKQDFINLALSGEAALSNPNPGGLFGFGACWWHSRFQRAVIYLSVLQPDEAKPSPKEAIEIIQQFIEMNHVVKIPGYSNASSFLKEYEDEVKNAIEEWQRREFPQTLSHGISSDWNRWNTSPNAVQQRMDALFHDVHDDKKIEFALLVPTGSEAIHHPFDLHAYLITRMFRESDPASQYYGTVIDSNKTDGWSFWYKFGSDHITSQGTYRDLIATEDFQYELDLISQAHQKYCGTSLF